MLAINPAPFQQQDPIFGLEISFYLFRLPPLAPAGVLVDWHAVFLPWPAFCLVYLLGNDNLSQGRFYGFSAGQQQHLYILAGALFLVTSLSHWLGRYEILYSQEGVVYGAGYTHMHVLLPANIVLAAVALVLGLVFLGRGLLSPPRLTNPIAAEDRRGKALPTAPVRSIRSQFKSTSLLTRGIAVYLGMTLLGLIYCPRYSSTPGGAAQRTGARTPLH